MKIQTAYQVLNSVVAQAVQVANSLVSTAKSFSISLIANQVWNLPKTSESSSQCVPVVKVTSVSSLDEHTRKRARLNSLRLKLAVVSQIEQVYKKKINDLKNAISTDKRVLVRLPSTLLSPEEKSKKKIEVETRIESKESELAAAQAALAAASQEVNFCKSAIEQENC